MAMASIKGGYVCHVRTSAHLGHICVVWYPWHAGNCALCGLLKGAASSVDLDAPEAPRCVSTGSR
jgi:hypothetical protein